MKISKKEQALNLVLKSARKEQGARIMFNFVRAKKGKLTAIHPYCFFEMDAPDNEPEEGEVKLLDVKLSKNASYEAEVVGENDCFYPNTDQIKELVERGDSLELVLSVEMIALLMRVTKEAGNTGSLVLTIPTPPGETRVLKPVKVSCQEFDAYLMPCSSD